MQRAEKQTPQERVDGSDQDNTSDARRFLQNAEHVTPTKPRASILSPITRGNGR